MRSSSERPGSQATSRADRGGVRARGLLSRLGARREPMPIQHALAIVVSAANRVHAAHIAGNRLYTTPETTLVRFDGVVEVEASPAPGSNGHADVTALGRMLAELIRGTDVPVELAPAFATAIDVEAGPASAAELSRALAFAAREAGIRLSRGELGKWARRQVHPPRLAHTLRRDDVPELGVDIGAVKPRPRPKQRRLAEGSDHAELMPRAPGEEDTGAIEALEVEAEIELDIDVDDLVASAGADDLPDDLIEAAVAPARAVVALPSVRPARPPRAVAAALVAVLAVLVMLAGAGWVLFYR
jgi:hypothetical protein